MTVITETTDAAARTSTSYTMAIGDTFQGALGAAGDRDWVAITLTAGETYNISLFGDGSPTQLSDPYLRLYNAGGSLIGQNDDGGAGLNSALSFTPTSTGTYYIAAGSFNDIYAGNYEIAATVGGPPPVFTLDEISNQLTNVYWGGSARSFNVAPDGIITVDITDLTAAGQQLARWALEAWSSVSGLEFSEVSSGADITFDDDASGAYSSSVTSGGTILSSIVNVSTGWLSSYGTALGSYSFQTYVHEIGHALGLGHAGNYNGTATYGVDNDYLNDSWQATVMSYFSQTDNTYINASYAYLATPMAADILAIQDLYGTTGSNTGNTTYGANSNVSGYLGDLFGQLMGEDPANSALYNGNAVAMTLVDSGGIDTLDLSPATANQVIDLTPEAASNILGRTGNLVIAQGTIIENVIGGSGQDRIIGNAANNVIDGGGATDTFVMAINSAAATVTATANGYQVVSSLGTDTLTGVEFVEFLDQTLDLSTIISGPTSGNDVLFGTTGNDTIDLLAGDDHYTAYAGVDQINGSAGNDTLIGGAGADSLDGGVGTDTADYSTSADGVVVRLWNGTGQGGDAQGDVLVNIENVIGSDQNDALIGADNVNNVLSGGGGADYLNGLSGINTADYSTSADGVVVRLWNGTGQGGDAQGDVLVNIENVIGSDQNDALIGADNVNNVLSGGGGADYLNGLSGTNTADYSTSAGGVVVRLWNGTGQGGDAEGDVLVNIQNVTGSDQNDALIGADNVNNLLSGGGGADYLNGLSGDDTLIGGAGDDNMAGGAGADEFQFAVGFGHDVVLDFENGIDHVDLANGLTYADVVLTSITGGVRVEIAGNASDFIDLLGVTLSEIDSFDFI